jgi:hypothetical protein
VLQKLAIVLRLCITKENKNEYLAVSIARLNRSPSHTSKHPNLPTGYKLAHHASVHISELATTRMAKTEGRSRALTDELKQTELETFS